MKRLKRKESISLEGEIVKEIPVNLNGLEREDVFAVASALLFSLKDTPKYSVISELFYILDYENFLRLIKYFGGMTLKIPTTEEISETMRVLLLYQYTEVEEMDWQEAMSRAGVDLSLSYSMKNKVVALKRLLKKLDVGGRHYD